MQFAIAVVGLGAAAAWLSAVVSCVGMVKHRAPGVSVGYLLTHGIAFFTGSSFTAEAAPHRRRFLASAAIFFTCLIALGVIGATISRT